MELIKKRYTLILSVLIIGIVITMPIFFIVKESLAVGLNEFYYFLNDNVFDFFNQTFKLIFLTSFFTLLFAVFPAYIISFYNIKFKKVLDILLILPLAIPCYIMAFTYSDILGLSLIHI